MKQLILIFLGGGVGSISRYLIGRLLHTDMNFPYGTFLVNVLGSFIIGLILGYTLRQQTTNENLNLLLAVGFCGGFTTFSTFAYENINLLKMGDYKLFLLYSFGSLCTALLAVFLGLFVMK